MERRGVGGGAVDAGIERGRTANVFVGVCFGGTGEEGLGILWEFYHDGVVYGDVVGTDCGGEKSFVVGRLPSFYFSQSVHPFPQQQ